MQTADPTKRFSDRVENYIRYRPSYPAETIDFLQQQCQLQPGSDIADVGSGTGIFTALLLNRGYRVFAVEPNAAMQEAAVEQFKGVENFIPVNGTAEATTLGAGSVELVVCAQAFHWFDAEKTKQEFKRILADGGHVALIWNNRNADTDDFAKAYENVLKNDSIDYNKVNHRNIKDIDFKAFFKNDEYQAVKYPNVQVFDEAGFLGRAYSSSYVPADDTPEGEKFRQLLLDIFAKYNRDGKVKFHYQTEIYFGQV